MADVLEKVLVSEKVEGILSKKGKEISSVNIQGNNAVKNLANVLYENGVKYIKCTSEGNLSILSDEQENGKTKLTDLFNVKRNGKIVEDGPLDSSIKGVSRLLCQKTLTSKDRKGYIERLDGHELKKI